MSRDRGEPVMIYSEALDKAMCSVLGHTVLQSDYGSYCNRCGEKM